VTQKLDECKRRTSESKPGRDTRGAGTKNKIEASMEMAAALPGNRKSGRHSEFRGCLVRNGSLTALSPSHSSPRDTSLCPYSHPPIVFYFLATPSHPPFITSVLLSFPYMSEQHLPSAPVCHSQTCSRTITYGYTACRCPP
jgi:hypothetical protein